MFGIGAPELIIILVIILIIFGVGKLPQVGEGLGKAIRGFKRGVAEPEEPGIPPKKVGEDRGEEDDEKRS